MAPEQARGLTDQVDARSDLFAVGAVLFRAVSGRPIHEKASAFDTTIAAMREPAPSLAAVMPQAPPRLVEAVDRALAFEREARWQTARDMFEALRSAYSEICGARLESRAPAPRPPRESEPPPSLVIDVAFGDEHDEALSVERRRINAAIEEFSILTAEGDT
jgi:serine/threonine-protein kinase